jgi:hypothetical protein
VYADTPSFLWPLAERSLLAHLVKLVEEGRAIRAIEVEPQQERSISDGSSWRRP